MKPDQLTLPLFSEAQAAVPPARLAPGLMSSQEEENFNWWCQHGNTAYCGAYLHRAFGIQWNQAQAIARVIHDRRGAPR